MSEEPKIRRGSRVTVARLYGSEMPDCCVSNDVISPLVGDASRAGTVVWVDTVDHGVLDGAEFVWSDVWVAAVIFDGEADDQWTPPDCLGMPLMTAWRIPVACLQEVPDERVTTLEAEIGEMWAVINGFVHEEDCPVCGDGPQPVRRWLHDGDRVACVCGHEGRVSACSESMPYLEWDEVSDG